MTPTPIPADQLASLREAARRELAAQIAAARAEALYVPPYVGGRV